MLGYGFGDKIVHWNAFNRVAALARRHTGHNLGPVLFHHFGLKRP